MATQVVKRDGTKEPFDAAKIRKAISTAALKAGLSEEEKSRVVEQVMVSVTQMIDAKDEITTAKIREKVLSELDRIEPSVSEAWRNYDEENKGSQNKY